MLKLFIFLNFRNVFRRFLMNFEKIVDDIISVSDSIRFVMIIDEQGKVVQSKITTKSYLLRDEHASLLAMDMQVLRKLLKLYDEFIGENTFVHLIRKQVHVLIFYVKEWIFMVSCDRNTTRHKIADISEEIDLMIKHFFI